MKGLGHMPVSYSLLHFNKKTCLLCERLVFHYIIFKWWYIDRDIFGDFIFYLMTIFKDCSRLPILHENCTGFESLAFNQFKMFYVHAIKPPSSLTKSKREDQQLESIYESVIQHCLR